VGAPRRPRTRTPRPRRPRAPRPRPAPVQPQLPPVRPPRPSLRGPCRLPPRPRRSHSVPAPATRLRSPALQAGCSRRRGRASLRHSRPASLRRPLRQLQRRRRQPEPSWSACGGARRGASWAWAQRQAVESRRSRGRASSLARVEVRGARASGRNERGDEVGRRAGTSPRRALSVHGPALCGRADAHDGQHASEKEGEHVHFRPHARNNEEEGASETREGGGEGARKMACTGAIGRDGTRN